MNPWEGQWLTPWLPCAPHFYCPAAKPCELPAVLCHWAVHSPLSLLLSGSDFASMHPSLPFLPSFLYFMGVEESQTTAWHKLAAQAGKWGLIEIFQHVLVHAWRASFVLGGGISGKCFSAGDRSSSFAPKQSWPGRICCGFLDNTSAQAWCLQPLSIVFLFNINLPYISSE